MFIRDDSAYYLAREADARRLARQASDPAARHAHLSMAAEYHRLAEAVRKKKTTAATVPTAGAATS